MTSRIHLDFQGNERNGWREVAVHNLVIAGWTGRDPVAVEKHIRELAELGVMPPSRTPIFYRVGASLLTTAGAVDVIGTDSTGEVEFVVLNEAGDWWIGVGSDHTDRKAEALGVTMSKQMCPKPLAPCMWRFDTAEPHWDNLILRSYAVSAGERTLYQQGPVSAMRPPGELIELYCRSTGAPFESGTAMFCGTLAVRDGIHWAESFVIELEDPVLRRKITHSYQCRALPIEG